MNPSVIPLIWLGASFLLLFGIAELLYRKLNVAAEHTRSIVHAGTGLLTLLFPVVLNELWQVIALCGSFLVLLLMSMRYGWLPSINAVPRRTQGSWLYPVVVVLTFAFYQHMDRSMDPLFQSLYYFYVPLLLLAICDPLAASAGRMFRRRYPDTAPGKTFAGSFTFLLLAALICIAASILASNHVIPAGYFVATGIVTAFAVTLAERFSDGGWDNLSIPLTTIACMYLIDYTL